MNFETKLKLLSAEKNPFEALLSVRKAIKLLKERTSLNWAESMVHFWRLG